MTECVILYRNPWNGRVGFIHDGDGEIAVYKDFDDAGYAARDIPMLQAAPYQIVELDELPASARDHRDEEGG